MQFLDSLEYYVNLKTSCMRVENYYSLVFSSEKPYAEKDMCVHFETCIKNKKNHDLCNKVGTCLVNFLHVHILIVLSTKS